MKTVGLIPASGSATRLGGLPKFALPISETLTLLGWHVNNLLSVCDEVRVSTQAKWLPLVESMNLPIKLISKEPSTLSDAIITLANDCNDRYIFTMPDTFFAGSDENFFKDIFEIPSDIVLGCFPCPPQLRGKVGQVEIRSGSIIAATDKDVESNFPFMWGYMAFQEGQIQKVNPESNTPSLLINQWILSGTQVGARMNSGEYIDAGSFEGVKKLYTFL